MEQSVEIRLALSIRAAEEGVDYTARRGALCPWCGERLRVSDTKPWQGGTRIRYQRCANASCPLCVMDKGVKTVETD